MERAHAADLDNVGAGAGDLGAHRVEEVCQIDDMGLLRRVFDVGRAVCEHGADHDVHRRADRHLVKIDACAVQPPTLGSVGIHEAVLHVDRSAQCCHALDVLLDRTNAEIAAAGKGDLRMAETAELRADQVIGSTDAADQLDRRDGIAHVRAVHLDHVCRQVADRRAHLVKDLEQKADIGNIGDVFNAAIALYEQRCRKNTDCRILCAADLHGSAQRIAPVNNILDHVSDLLYGKRSLNLRIITELL